VYSRGFTGKITGLIFGHFRKCQENEWPEKPDRIIYGIDYGYTTDPTAIVKIAVVGRKRYWKELYYETGANSEVINAVLRNNGWEEDQAIYSEADPNMVNQLRILRLPVIPAIKGPGSIAAGISKVREFECFYTAESVNLEKELYQYKFVTAQDIVTGKEVVTNVPMAGWDHCPDAGRMAIYTDSFRHRSS
jgi:phage terminase large subunit